MRADGEDSFSLALNLNGKAGDAGYEWWPKVIEEDIGGAGLVCSAVDLQKILSSLTSNDGGLLKPTMFRENPQQAQFTAQRQEMGAELDYGLGASLTLTATDEGRHKETLSWSGLPNLYWWVDHEAGLNGTLFMSLFPLGDQVANGLFNMFRRSTYDVLEA
ncbi:hypothetical protein BDZ45DRAFT_736164 [Acephala macrosclerotiorum]|nr:hypothetical protein BDZ45DRAFT_736164 [Acephala macrosclerotiorum]